MAKFGPLTEFEAETDCEFEFGFGFGFGFVAKTPVFSALGARSPLSDRPDGLRGSNTPPATFSLRGAGERLAAVSMPPLPALRLALFPASAP